MTVRKADYNCNTSGRIEEYTVTRDSRLKLQTIDRILEFHCSVSVRIAD